MRTPTIPTSYASAASMLGSRDSRVVPSVRATRIERAGDGAIALRYHATVVAVWHPDGSVNAFASRHRTVTTKARINCAISSRGARVYQYKRAWYMRRADGTSVNFYDGVRA